MTLLNNCSALEKLISDHKIKPNKVYALSSLGFNAKTLKVIIFSLKLFIVYNKSEINMIFIVKDISDFLLE